MTKVSGITYRQILNLNMLKLEQKLITNLEGIQQKFIIVEVQHA